MRKFFLLVLPVLACISCLKESVANIADILDERITSETKSFANQVVTKEDALKFAEKITSLYPDRWVDISDKVVPANTEIRYNLFGYESEIGFNTIQSPDYDSWLLRIESDPLINGGGPAIHIFVNASTGMVEYKVLEGSAIYDWDESRYTFLGPSNGEVVPRKEYLLSSGYNAPSRRWAVLINGGGDKSKNFQRYWNDCQEVYLALTQDLGYLKSHIYCLCSDGTSSSDDRKVGPGTYDSSPLDFDGDGTTDIQYSATKGNLQSVLTSVRNSAAYGDEVLLFFTGHGSNPYGEYAMWGGSVMDYSFLQTELNKFSEFIKIDVVMGQCGSGKFTIVNGNNITVSAACNSDEDSHANAVYNGYDYFLHFWTASLTASISGAINPDLDANGYRSIREMFLYAQSNVQNLSLLETPKYRSLKTLFGFSHDLLNNEFYPMVTGSEHLSNNYNNNYSYSGIPSSAVSTVSWSSTGYTTLLSSDSSSAIVRGNLTSTSDFASSVGSVVATFTYYGETYDVVKNIVSIWKPGMYSGFHHITGGGGVYHVTEYPGGYGYYWQVDNSAWTILTQGSSQVYVQEGSASGHVNLMVGFFDPFGEMIIVEDSFN
ncbi:MAG: hypothetical protein IJ584_08765 [Bacteroidales bacterium]|nr:hypothetical protein [Bacteroidales bacterium]